MVTFPFRPELSHDRPRLIKRSLLAGKSGLALVLILLFLSAWKAPAQADIHFATETSQSGSDTQAVPVSFKLAGSLAEIRVLSAGASNADFRLLPGGTCSVGQSYAASQACVAQVKFTPQAPGERRGAVLLLDQTGNVLGEQRLYGIGTGPVAVFTAATINTVAGNGQWLYTGDNRLATDAPIFLPGGVAVDALGNVYIADSGNNRIRRIDASSHLISTVAGNGTPGNGGDGGPALSASISNPGALLLDGAGDLFIADSGNHAIRKLVLATGKLTTIAGQLGQSGYSGDGGLASAATLNTPEGLALDNTGALYIADTKNHAIRKIDPVTQLIETIAGDGTPAFSGDGGLAIAARLNAPWGIATDSADNLYIADLNNNRIRKVSGGIITTIMGDGTATLATDGQPASVTPIYNPAAVAVDVAGNIYVADSGHNVVRKMNAVTGIATAVAGTVSPSYTGDGGPATAAGIYGPYALTLDSAGNVYIADIFHHRIREIFTAQAFLSYPAIRVGRTSAPQPETVENDGNASLNWSSFAPDANSALSASTTTCATGTPLAVNATCSIGAEFFPQVTGQKVTADLQLLSDAVNSPATITLSGEVDELDPTSTTLSVSSTPLILGAPGTLQAKVTGTTATQPVGNVRFYDGTTLLGTSATNASGIATFNTSGLTLGTHSITANFTGDTTDSPSTSAALTVTVKQQPTVSLTSGLNPAKVGDSIIFSASVAASAVQPTGTVTLAEGNTTLITAPLSNGLASFTLSNLTAGSHTLIATYSGDASTISLAAHSVTETVAKWSSTTTLAANPATSTVSTDVTYSVTVSPSSTSIPVGTVTLQNNGTPFASLTLGAAGTATYTTGTLPVGSHAITAVFSGDSVNDASTSASLATTVQPASTLTTLASSTNPAKAGASLQLTANVSTTPSSLAASLPILSGTVTFKDGATVLGSAPVSSSGTASFTPRTLSVGTHPITAVYSGDTDHATSTSTVLSQEIDLATSTVQLSASGSSLTYGRTLTLTAVVGGDGAIPTGSVTFLDGTTTLGTATINASGQATLTISTLSTGSHTLSASYPGDSKDRPGTSNNLTEVITQATTGMVLVSSANPSVAGTAVTFVATLNSTGSLPSGQIVFSEGATTLGSALLDASGIARITLSSLTAGTHTLVATFAGDTEHAASASPAVSQVVNLATSAVALSSSANPALINTPVVLTATVTGTGLKPTGSVTFTDGSTVLGMQPINAAGVATLSTSALTLGAHTLAVTYTGDTTHSPSAAATLNERIQQATTATVTSSSNPTLVGASVTLTATVTGAAPGLTGTVTFLDGASTVGSAPLGANGVATLRAAFAGSGTHRLSATFSGDASDQASTSATLAEVVNVATTSVALTSSANPSVVGNSVTFTATVTSIGERPAGSVTLLDGPTTLATARVTGGVATFAINTLQAGSHSLTATYAGDTGTGTSTSGVLLQVARQTTATSLATSAASILTNQAITLTATVAGGTGSTGSVTFLDGSTILGTAAANTSGQSTLAVPSLSAGSHALSAQFSGDQYHLPSNSSPVTETVQLRPSTTSLTSSSDSYLTGEQLTLVAVIHTTGPVSPTGTVVFTSGDTTLGTSSVSSAGAATLIFSPTAPSYSVIATYKGDPSYSGSVSTAYALTAGSTSTFTISTNPSELTLASGAHESLTLTLNSPSGFGDTLSFGCIDLPADATCTFPESEVALAAHGTATVQVIVDTGNPLGSGRATASQARLKPQANRSVVSASVLAPLAALFGLLLWRSRARLSLPSLLLLLLCTAAGLGLSGCGTPLNSAKTPAGSYKVRIVAAGTGTGVSQFATITVTVK